MATDEQLPSSTETNEITGSVLDNPEVQRQLYGYIGAYLRNDSGHEVAYELGPDSKFVQQLDVVRQAAAHMIEHAGITFTLEELLYQGITEIIPETKLLEWAVSDENPKRRQYAAFYYGKLLRQREAGQ